MQISEHASFDGTEQAELVRTNQVSTAEILDAAGVGSLTSIGIVAYGRIHEARVDVAEIEFY